MVSIMGTMVLGGQKDPLTYANAPRYWVDGVLYVEHDAALELAAQIAADDAELLARLARS